MSGHSKWKQIKGKKAVTDEKRGQLFTRFLNGIRVAAKSDPNPEFNPHLKAAIAKAKEENVPQENIERAINQAKDGETEELLIEAYGPHGSPLIIAALTDNKNRTVAEIKKILSDHDAKMADPGSVLWAFERNGFDEWTAKFPKSVDPETREKISALIDELDKNDDVTKIYTSTL
ncbi:MAG: YebC/PmpR family DNA-binding transcriptional regulator [Candidatus Colwellbacteria bacterium]|nr:YebC/PmpR family DNA-binding transcriptional regulator [Candidatus Colwellbacteria bacterium]